MEHLGGGVMKLEQLFPLVRDELKRLLNGYVETQDLDEYITSPELGDNAGVMGCLLLASEVSKDE
jgi:fructokinase